MSLLGHKRTNYRGLKSTVVRCYSNSGQTLRRSEMTLSAISDQRTAANGTKRKTAPRRSLRNPIRCVDQAAASAAACFRFLRRANRPMTPTPPAKSGRAAGRGVAFTEGPSTEKLSNAAAVALVVDQAPGFGSLSAISPTGFNLIARNSDAAGTCGFNWIALLQLFGTAAAPTTPVLPRGAAASPVNLMVDTGEFGAPTGPEINFKQAGTVGDWFSAEVQFSRPFAVEPVVLITPHFPPPYYGEGPPSSNVFSGCAPVAMAQNVTRFGFTLAAHNTDTNNTGGNASFYWVAFGF
jgi:hypothetical protein